MNASRYDIGSIVAIVGLAAGVGVWGWNQSVQIALDREHLANVIADSAANHVKIDKLDDSKLDKVYFWNRVQGKSIPATQP